MYDGTDVEAAFSNYQLWISIGFIISFILPQFTCMLRLVGWTSFSLAVGGVCAYIWIFCTYKTAEIRMKNGGKHERSVGSFYDDFCYQYYSTHHFIEKYFYL